MAQTGEIRSHKDKDVHGTANGIMADVLVTQKYN